MDMNGCKPLFGHQVVVNTSISKQFVGTLGPDDASATTVTLAPLPADVAAQYDFAINGVNALDVGVITFIQDLAQPH
jgi:hypothetical protein